MSYSAALYAASKKSNYLILLLFVSNLIGSVSIDNMCINRGNWKYICDFVYSAPFEPEKVFSGAQIIVTRDNVKQFFAYAHPHIKYPYFLISMDGDVEPRFLDEHNVTACFTFNSPVVNHPKFRLIEGSHICHFVYAPPFEPEKVFSGAKIFITGHNVKQFFAYAHPHIKYPYFLISMDGGVEPRFLDEPNIIAWFGNESYPPALNHPKFRLIPLGFSNEKGSHQSSLLEQFRAIPKMNLMYINFNLTEFGSRRVIYAMFKDRPYVKIGSLSAANKRIDFIDYMRETAECKFTISPIGDSFDCYRHWEPIMVGSIPIIMRGLPCESLFEGLPVLFIDSLDDLTEEFLNKKYAEISSKQYDLSKLYMRYWSDIINSETSAWKNAHCYL